MNVRNNSAIFCGGFYMPEDVERLLRDTKSALSWANNTLQWSYIDGFSECYGTLYSLSAPQLGSYPKRYKKLFFKSHITNGNVQCCSFCNISLLKKYSRKISVLARLNDIVKKMQRNSNIHLYIYDVDIPLIKAALTVRKKYPNIKICLIVPDLPDLTGHENKILWRIYGKIREEKMHRLYKQIDNWILLSKYMVERIPEAEGKSIVIEGMINTCTVDNTSVAINPKEKIILYTGAVSVRNNCINLAKAFFSVKDSSARLVFCGLGDAIIHIQRMAQLDPRIECRGQVNRKEVLQLQKQAYLLVNPRQGILDFSRYSFPSKLMEYYASGTPVLMYHIDGIPDEYYQFCLVPADLSITELTNSINKALGFSHEELRIIGNRARSFILTSKSHTKQCEKVMNFMKTI